MTAYCDCPAGLRLDGYAVDGTSLGTTLDFMAEENGIRVDSLDIGFPTVREAVAPHPTQDGNYDYTSLFGPRVVTVTGTFIASTTYTDRQGMMQALAGWCAPNIRPHLIYAIDPTSATLSLIVRGSQFSAPASNRKMSAFTASWVAPNPAATSMLLRELSVKAGETGELLNEGTYTAWPTFTVRGPCRDPLVEWQGGAAHFTGLELSEGEYVVVSPQARTVTFMGRSEPQFNRYRALDFARTRWQGLAPGVTEVYASAALDVAWRDTFI